MHKLVVPTRVARAYAFSGMPNGIRPIINGKATRPMAQTALEEKISPLKTAA
jgi:hypothetical protein